MMCPRDREGGVLRASGKRFRRQFNPSDWATSILTIRHNVLCLGMSYPCVERVIANYKGKNNVRIFHSAPSVERSVELVRRNLLNQIDGRDLARVEALEANNDILAYTVSKEEGAYYDQRHLNADFNSRTLVNQMHKRWGKTVKFRQVILDYFWSPSGSWAIKHWQRSFFNENIPRLVTENMFNFGDLENDSVFVSACEANTTEGFISSTAAVVYLPFCSRCLSEVVACYDKLSQFYTISFLRKDQLDEHTLWKATNTISPESMVSWLAKTINQEEIYCTVDARQIKHGTGDASVTKEDIFDVFNRIDRSNEVRMIKLTALRIFHPDYPKSEMKRARPTLGLNKGGYVGLLSKRQIAARKKVDAGNAKKVEQMQEMPRKSRKREKRDDSGSNHAPASDVALKTRSESEEEPNVLSDTALEWDRILTSFEVEYSKRINSGTAFGPNEASTSLPAKRGKTIEEIEFPNQLAPPRGICSHDTTKFPANDDKTIEETNVPSATEAPHNKQADLPAAEPFALSVTAEKNSLLASAAMKKVAKIRRPKPASSGHEAEQAGAAKRVELLQNDKVTPNPNDVLMWAGHHSHPGNVQFFNALAICDRDFSTVADCFVDALQSLDPPGRFLGRDESGTWACVDYDVAMQFVHHLLDDHIWNSSREVGFLHNESSSAFFTVVQRFFEAKSINGAVPDTSMAECEVIIPQDKHTLGEVCDIVNESTISSSSLTEYAENDRMKTPIDTEKISVAKKMGQGGACKPTSFGDDDGDLPEVYNGSSLPSESTITSTNTSNANQVVIDGLPVAKSPLSSPKGQTVEEASFGCLAEWLEPTTGSAQGNIASALRQISKEGSISTYKLLTHAVEEEKTSLQSLCALE